MTGKYVETAEYARLAGVSVWTVRRWAARGYGPVPRRVGGRLRWERDAVLRYLGLGPDRVGMRWESARVVVELNSMDDLPAAIRSVLEGK